MAGVLATSSKAPSKSKAQSKKGGKTPYSAEEMEIIQRRSERINRQRSVQLKEVGAVKTEKLGDNSLVSPRYFDLKVFAFVKMAGLADLLHQDWETVYTMAQREVYVPLVKEFYDCAVVINHRQVIKSKVNDKIISVTLNDMAEALNVKLEVGEKYSPNWFAKVDDWKCIWKNQEEPLTVEVGNLIDDVKFNNAVISKVVLPKDGARNYVNAHARYALYKILKRVKINPAHLMWNYLINYLEKSQGYLPFGSLLTVIFEKKGVIKEFLESEDRLNEDVIFPSPIRLGDVSKMNIPFDASDVPEEYLPRTRKNTRGKEKVSDEQTVQTRKKNLTELSDVSKKEPSKRIVPAALRIAPFPEDEEEQSVRIKIVKSGEPLQSQSNPIASRTRSGKGSPPVKKAEPKKLKRLRKQFEESQVTVEPQPAYQKRKILSAEPEEPFFDEDIVLHTRLANSLLPYQEIPSEMSNKEFLDSLFVDNTQTPHSSPTHSQHHTEPLPKLPPNTNLNEPLTETTNEPLTSQPNSTMNTAFITDQTVVAQENASAFQLVQSLPKSLIADEHMTSTLKPFTKASTKKASRSGTVLYFSQARKRRLQTLVSSAIQRRRTLRTTKGSFKSYLNLLARKIDKSSSNQLTATWKRQEGDNYLFQLHACKVPDPEFWKLSVSEGYVGTLPYSLMNRTSALSLKFGTWVFVLLPTHIPEVVSHSEKANTDKGKGKMLEEADDTESQLNSSADGKEEDESEGLQADFKTEGGSSSAQVLATQFVTREDFEDHRDHINQQFMTLAQKIDQLLTRFG